MRLIDADALERDGWHMSRTVQIDKKTMELQTRKPTDFPAVEPQPEIIRCKDCKYAEVADTEDSQDGYTCQFHRGSIWFSGSYCSWAERREE